MKLFFAGAESDLKNLNEIGVKRLLITIAHGKNKIKKMNEIYDPGYELIMDSGAFTFHRKGGITVEKWLEKVNEVKHNVTEIISLDVIGDAEKTFDNFIEIQKYLPEAMPTFHVGSDIKYLKKYMDITDRIAIGGIVTHGVNKLSLLNHLNDIFKIVDRNNLPKLHAFGVFNQKLLQKYPFYSCDASSWNSYAKFDEFETIDMFFKKRARSKKKNKDIFNYSLEELIGNTAEERIDKLRISANNFLKLEYFLTNLWEERGIKWD